MKKIFTYRCRQTVEGSISVEAESIEEADRMRQALDLNECAVMNGEVGEMGETFIDATGTEDTTPDDGNHLFQTPRANAAANAEALEEALADL